MYKVVIVYVKETKVFEFNSRIELCQFFSNYELWMSNTLVTLTTTRV